MKKTCERCGEEKDISEFFYGAYKPEDRQPDDKWICKDCADELHDLEILLPAAGYKEVENFVWIIELSGENAYLAYRQHNDEYDYECREGQHEEDADNPSVYFISRLNIWEKEAWYEYGDKPYSNNGDKDDFDGVIDNFVTPRSKGL